MADEVKEFIDESVDILPLLRKINKDSIREYCNRHISLFYFYEGATFGFIQDNLLDWYEGHRSECVRQAIDSAMESNDPEYAQLVEFIVNCVASALNSDKSLYNCVYKTITRGNDEEFYYVANRLYKEVVEYIYNKYESAICIGEYDEIYSIVDEYDKEYENRYQIN